MKYARKPYFLGLLGLAFLIVLSSFGIFSGVKPVLLSLAKPFILGSQKVGHGIGAVSSAVFGVPYNAEDVRSLREENAAMRARIEYLKEAERENAELRKAFNRTQKFGVETIQARVIAKSQSGSDDYLVLDAGRADGISIGAPVLVQGDMVIGEILEAGEGTSKVRLISDVAEKTEVYIPEADLVSVAEGLGLGVFSIKVPSSFEISAGDGIFSMGAHNYLVGFVDKIEKSEAGPFQVVKSKIPLNLYDIRQVFVVKGQ